MSAIRLVVQADDLGMCRAVNAGIEHAVVDGIVTQASVMAPTPWFVEGAMTARRLGLTTGLHSTLTCEWEHLRWAPLSTGATLRLADGTMPRTVEHATDRISHDDALAELRLQAQRATACGLDLAYVDVHMGTSVISVYPSICKELGVRFLYPGVEPHHRFESIYVLSMSSTKDLGARTGRFIDWIERLDGGTHFVLTHPGVPGEELQALCEPDAFNAVWAETWRAADLATLTDPEVRAVIERRGIELLDVTAL